MRVVLDLRAGGWLGGRYYLHNLALAIRALPADERPELLCLNAGESEDDLDRALPPVAAGLADADVVFPNWGLSRRTAATEMHWIPDLQHRSLPGNFSRLERLKRELGYRRFASRAAAVVVSSETTRRQAARAFPLAARKLHVVHFRTVVPKGATSADAAACVRELGLPEEFLLLPNQFWVHKNHRVAFAAIPQLELPLVCTGATDDHRHPGHFAALQDLLRASGATDRVHVLGVVERGVYLQLVRACRAILQPSRFEGWSSIVEDARAFGKPIALSDIPVHREQDPPDAAYFHPDDPSALAAAVRAALDAPPLGEAQAVERQGTLVATYARRFLEVARCAVERRR